MTVPRLIPHRLRDTDAELGTIEVPVLHGHPHGARIELSFVRLRERRGGGRPAVVFLTGGPGLSGIRSGEGRLFPMFDELREDRDVILLDQRACAVDARVLRHEGPRFPRDRVVSREQYVKGIARTVRRDVGALEAAGIPPWSLRTNESADDVALIVRALYGDGARMALLGWSYGSHLAMAIMKRHEAMLDRVVLAAPEGPDHTFKLPSRVQEHLDRLSKRAGRDLVGLLARALDRLEREPAVVPMPADESGTADVTLGRFDLEWAISELAADTRALRKLPAWLERMDRGDFQVLGSEPLLRGAWEALREELPHAAVRYCFDCASNATTSRYFRIMNEADETLLRNTIDFPLPDICDALGCPEISLEPSFRDPVRSNVPVLFITGTLDCRTPAENVEDLAPGLPAHRHLVVADAGHGDLLLPSGVQAAIVRFLHTGRAGATTVTVGHPFRFE